jgi:hypothetical protein
LVESDFTNGEATIITTDSSTAHVIKNVQAIDVDSEIPLNAKLDVNGFDVVNLTANSSGSEIIAPSSTVKVKTSVFPLEYVDYEIAIRTSSSNYSTNTLAYVNDIEAASLSPIYNATNSMQAQTLASNQTIFAPKLGPNEFTLVAWSDSNSNTQLRLNRESDGTQIFSEGSSYSQKWFDGKQYVYYYATTLGTGLHRLDAFTGTETLVDQKDYGGRSTYQRTFGISEKYIFIWATSSEATSYVYDIQAGTSTPFINGPAASSVFAHMDKFFFAVERSDGTVIIMVIDAQDTIKWWEWTPGTVITSSNLPATNTLTLSGNSEHFRDYNGHHATKGSRLYYVNNDSEKLAYLDFETATPTQTVIGTQQLSAAYGWDTTFVERTPTSSTISSRTGYPAPSLKLRMTGVTST